MSERYGEKHPEFIKVTTQLANTERQLENEINKAVQNAKNEYEGAVTQERVINESLNESKAAATNLGRKGVDYSALQREAESNRAVYNQLLTREKELRVVANSRTNNVRVVDRAEVPARPYHAEPSARLGLRGRARPGPRPWHGVRHRLPRRHRQDA